MTTFVTRRPVSCFLCAFACAALAVACERPASSAGQRGLESAPAVASSPSALAAASAEQQIGWIALRNKSWPAAEAKFRAALALEAHYADPWLGLGHALFWQERYPAARAAFEQANRLEPAHPRALGGVAHCELNEATRAFQTPAKRRALLLHARALFHHALALDPNEYGAHQGLAFVKIALERSGAPPLGLQLLAAGALLGLLAFASARVRARGVTRAWRALLHALFQVAPAFVATRGLVFLAFWFSPRLLAEATPHPISVLANASDPILRAVAQRWDSNLYGAVALEGYRAAPDVAGMWSSLGQLPLTPILYRFSMYALGDAHLAALVLPQLLLLCACLLLFALLRDARAARDTRDLRDAHAETGARRGVAVLLLLPGSLFGSVLYAEPVALVFMLATLFALRRGYAFPAVLAGLLAGMSRLNALALVPLLVCELWGARRHSPLVASFVLLAPCAGVAAYMLFTQLAFGDALAYFHELHTHRFAGQGILVALDDAGRALGAQASLAARGVAALGVVCIVAYAAAAFAAFRERAFGAAFCIVAGIVFALGSSLAAQPRYLWLLFPACAYFAAWPRGPLTRVFAALLLACVLGLEALGYAAWYYVT